MSELVTLGKSGLQVHPIGLGANKISDADPSTNTERTKNYYRCCG